MKQQEKKPILPVLLTGILTCLMISMMSLGGHINLQCFLGTESIYDFPETEFVKLSKGWEYDAFSEGYYIVKKNAVNKYRIDHTAKTWKYLYITLDKLSVPSLSATLEYYNKEKELLFEQPISLVQGKNEILMNEEISVYRIGIRIRDAKGTFFSISSMQARSERDVYDAEKFRQLMLITNGIFFAGFSVWLIFRRKYSGRRKKIRQQSVPDVLQTAYVMFGDYFGQRIAGRMSRKTRTLARRILFSVFFAWIIFCQIMGWTGNEETYRFFALGIVFFLLFAGILSWERPLTFVRWETPLASAWMFLWIAVMISDFFVEKGIKFSGHIMFLAGGFFIFVWNQMERPRVIFKEIIESLELDFWLVVVVCMLFRQKKIAVYYNGIFCSAEEFTVYALLMFGVFLTGVIKLRFEKDAWKKCAAKIAGMGSSVYFVLRAGNNSSILAMGLVALVLILLSVFQNKTDLYAYFATIKKHIGKVLISGSAAVVFVCLVHAAIESLPGMLKTDAAFENDVLVSVLPTEELVKYQILFPEELKDVVSWDTLEIEQYQKSYARLLNLTGHMAKVRVYREIVEPYNGYLGMMYRYGMYAVVPLVLYQVYVLGMAYHFSKQHRHKNREQLWMISVAITVIYACLAGNLYVSLSHPLLWCFYLMGGYYFVERK